MCSRAGYHSVSVCVRVGRQLISQEALFSFLFPPPTDHYQSFFLLLAAVEKQRDNKVFVSLFNEPQTCCVTEYKAVP